MPDGARTLGGGLASRRIQDESLRVRKVSNDAYLLLTALHIRRATVRTNACARPRKNNFVAQQKSWKLTTLWLLQELSAKDVFLCS
jgi:hypothetical protein